MNDLFESVPRPTRRPLKIYLIGRCSAKGEEERRLYLNKLLLKDCQ